VEIVPAYPVPGEPLVIRVNGTSGYSFATYTPYRVELVGGEIVVEGCVPSGGFAVPSEYWRSIPIVGLPAGTYTILMHRAPCSPGTTVPVGPPQFRAATIFTVDPAHSGKPEWRTYLPVWEYHNATTLEYFYVSDEREIVALDSGRIPGWRPTFRWFVLDAVDGDPWCRFYSPSFPGKAPHFSTSRPDECAAVKQNPRWTFEGHAGFAAQPDATGACPGRTPLYRAFNNGKFGAPNHRYRAGSPLFEMIMYEGWVDEGVVACLPQY
jgi:hypothetical protein